jgi:hypothetical protein
MLTRIVLAVALVLGAAAVAQASSGRDENGGQRGGYHIGPFGQWLGGPPFRPYYWGYRYLPTYINPSPGGYIVMPPGGGLPTYINPMPGPPPMGPPCVFC